MARKELKYQGHIIKSYKSCEGFAERWNNEWVKGPPDLICALDKYKVHLMEVKHMPTLSKVVRNPMTPKQIEYARSYLMANGLVVLGIVRTHHAAVRDERDVATDSEIGIFHPLSERIDPSRAHWMPYRPKLGYDIVRAMAGRELQPYGVRTP